MKASGLISGDWWALKCLALAFLCGLIFSYAPAVAIHRNVDLPPAYSLKAEHPLADTSQLKEPAHEGERLHGAKLTPRLTGSFLLWMARHASLHPYLPASLFGLLFLLSGIIAAHQITGDRLSGLLLGLLYAGLYASSACFAINWMPKPFDGVAIGLVGLASMLRGRPWCLFLSCFLACWADERAMQGLFFIALLFHAWPCADRNARYRPLLVMGAAVVSYLLTRFGVALALGWHAPDMNLMSPPWSQAVSFVQPAAWTSFEGGWFIMGSALLLMTKMKAHVRLGVLSCALVLAITASIVVLDASRVGAFSFPLILVALAYLQHANMPALELRRLLGLSAAMTLLAPNYEIIVGVAVKWLPSALAYLVLAR